MKQPILITIAITFAVLLGGCSTFGKPNWGRADTPVVSAGVPETARTKLQNILQTWQQTPDKTQTIDELSRLAPQYSSPDASWEIAVYSAISLAYLENGDAKNFLGTVHTLRGYIQPNRRLPRPTQYVIAVSNAMERRQVDDGILVEYRLSAVANALFGNPTGKQQ